MKREQAVVAPGNRYQKADSTRITWVVRDTYTPGGFKRHVRAHPVNDPSDLRLYAASVFGDPTFFSPVHVKLAEAPQRGNKAG